MISTLFWVFKISGLVFSWRAIWLIFAPILPRSTQYRVFASGIGFGMGRPKLADLSHSPLVIRPFRAVIWASSASLNRAERVWVLFFAGSFVREYALFFFMMFSFLCSILQSAGDCYGCQSGDFNYGYG